MHLTNYNKCCLNIKTLIVIFYLFQQLQSHGQNKYVTEFINVDGKKMAYKSYGLKTRKTNNPVLVFESGLGGGKENFEVLFPFLSHGTAGISYDRNGIGGSQSDTTIKSDVDVVKRLHDFLVALKVTPPYLLVGHSLGGAFIRLFPSLYPTEVNGLVFIDATDFMLTKKEDEEVKRNSASATGYRELYVGMLDEFEKDTLIPAGVRSEMKRVADLNRVDYFKEYTLLKPLPDIPVTVLMQYNRPIEHQEMILFKEFKINGEAWFKELNRYRLQHFAEMIENNHNSSVILLPGYSHGIQHQDPELVANAIQNVYKRSITPQK